mmetsp:Transcript_49141/g.107078  ORF Transcript_49141/g.107078 Transcript_49141/m.107078 type:complete len:236 (-) Transcript_49141:651-1358(-)
MADGGVRGPGHGSRSSALSLPIPLQDDTSKCDAQEIHHVRGDGGATGHNHLAAVQPHLLPNLVEDNLVPQPVVHLTSLQPLFLGSKSSFEQRLLDAPGLHNTLPQLVVHTVQQPRHGGERSGSQSSEIFQDLQGVPLIEADGSSLHMDHLLDSPLEDMGERQVGQVNLAPPLGPRVPRQLRQRSGQIRDNVLVGQQSSLGITGGARRVTKRKNVRRARWSQRLRLLLPGLDDLIE